MGDHTHSGLEWVRHSKGYWYGISVLYGNFEGRKVVDSFGQLSEQEYFALKLRGEGAMRDKLLELWFATL